LYVPRELCARLLVLYYERLGKANGFAPDCPAGFPKGMNIASEVLVLSSQRTSASVTPVNSTLFNSYQAPNAGGEHTRRRRWKTILRAIADIFCINLVFILAYLMRYNLQLGKEVLEENQVPLGYYWVSQLVFTLIFFLALQFKGFYRINRTTTLLDQLGIIASSAAYSVLAIIVLVFIFQPPASSRLMYLFLFPLACVILGAQRLIVWRVRRSLVMRGLGVRRVLVVGATDVARRLMQALTTTPSLGLHLVGYVDDDIRFSEWNLPLRYRTGDEVPHLGNLSELALLTEQYKVQEIVLALPATMHDAINDVITLCLDRDMEFMLVPDTFELRVNAIDIQEINGVPLIGLKDNRLTGFNYFIKRTVDVTLALLFLAVAAIPMALIAIAVRLDSAGPIILRQTRVGKHGKTFTFYKFRSMYVDADERFKDLEKFNQTDGATFKMTEDPRRTKVGAFIRKTSLDELPQIFNILSGQMSFVGPRPGLERELNKYREWHFRRYEVTPGLTGLSQVSGRSNLKFDDTVRLDIYYAENWSLWLDLKIILRTIPTVLKREGAY
jgi:exopolysaccharide biosynthesis polyprenyl glycosylphosphotransferase